ncbi:hypothetical protein GTA08_BOTSDO13967 [Botryosphaeria dothidea]|uniref:O-methyltransferase domain-containing protein n=1 Tax=Botryosphaeria dothidea TaxID=55169 RepID=A0A8H4IT92_9PEZI|nr:hypothetical protein GTA08_BOTSDO06371 [Botryosphaeria dothidea]KAF4310536.1 hypothetical protein GTA08_BOTSDO13967 [Botryosphaeria dothidea]
MPLEALAETVTAHSKELDERGVVDPASPVGFRNLSPDDLACRSRLLTAIEELRRLALGPAETLHELMGIATCDIACLEALARYDIPSHVLLGGTIPIHSRASHVPHLAEATLARLLRNCIVIGAFAEPATVVDVGGGRGQASMCVADGTTERVRFVVQDLPATAALGRQMLPERFVVEFEHWKSTLDGLVKATWKP